MPGDATGGEVTIACQFNHTDATEVQVVPAAVAQAAGSQNGATESPVDDLTDDFAAGDAAVQVPVSFQSSMVLLAICCVSRVLRLAVQYEAELICCCKPSMWVVACSAQGPSTYRMCSRSGAMLCDRLCPRPGLDAHQVTP